jgi:hypothetical protein
MRLPSWLNFLSSASSRAPVRRPRRHRPSLEALEDRTALSDFTAGSVPQLIDAINQANLLGGDNKITLAAGKTFTLTAVNNSADGGNGLPVVAEGDNLSIVGQGATIERSTAKGTPAFRLFDVAAGATLTLTDLTLQGGLAYSSGGAIYSQGGLSLNGVTVQNNVARGYPPRFVFDSPDAAQGGGIWSSGALTLESTTIQNNLALGLDGADYPANVGGSGGSAYGGGVYVAGGTALLDGVTLSGNTAQGGNGGNGGVYQVSNGRGGFFYFPLAGGSGGWGDGGGLFAAAGTVTLLDTSVTSNTAKRGTGGQGGSLGSHHGPDGSPGAGLGGGLYVAADDLVHLDGFTVAHFKRNHASDGGPDIYGPYTPR